MAPALSAASRESFHRALDDTLPFGPSYAGSSGLELASHLPMVLGALYRLGAPLAAFERPFALWRPRLREVAAAVGAASADPPPYHAPYPEWLRHLEAHGSRADVESLLRSHLPALLLAPESGAFHGPIRLAHACDAGHRGELLHALAAWCASFRSLGPMPPAGSAEAPFAESPGTDTLRAALEAMRADSGLAMALRQDTTIFSDMQVAVDRPGFAAHLDRAHPSLDALAEASLAVYLATRDFTALHLVTGTHALRTLLARVELAPATQAEALRRAWRAWLAAWVSIGRPLPDWAAVHAGSAREADWDAALPALFATGNDHAIKLADAAREEWRLRGWPGFARCLPPRLLAAAPGSRAAPAAAP